MKALLISLLAMTSLDPAAIEWNELEHGAQYACIETNINDNPQHISVLRYKARKFKTEIANENGASADSTSTLILQNGGIAGINASYFNTRTLEAATYVRDDRVQEGWTDDKELYRVDGAILIRKGRKVVITPIPEESVGFDIRYNEVITSGPLLAIGGKEARNGEWPQDSFFTGRHPRTLLGTDSKGWIYMIVIDGRFPGQAVGMTIHETAQLALSFGLTDAINLDGGGSSVLWTQQEGTLSHPCDNRRYNHYGQRRVPNVIYIR